MADVDAVEDCLFGDDGEEVMLLAVDGGCSDAIAGRASRDNHSIDLLIDQQREKGRTEECAFFLLVEDDLAL
nr:hypothetical protein [Lichenihabitans psoromatis]